MKKVALIIRVLLGLILLVFGLNKLLQFMPVPPMSDAATEFMGALMKSGYILLIVALVEILAGVLLLINRFQPLVLVVLFPVLLNAFLFHLFLDPAGIGGAFLAVGMNIFLFFANKESYNALFKIA